MAVKGTRLSPCLAFPDIEHLRGATFRAWRLVSPHLGLGDATRANTKNAISFFSYMYVLNDRETRRYSIGNSHVIAAFVTVQCPTPPLLYR